MIKKTVIWGLGLVFVAALSLPAFADQSIGFQEYFNKGVKAFKEHDDQKALYYLLLAQIYDPADKELNEYLNKLDQMGVVLELPVSSVPPQDSIGFKYYFSKGVTAYQDHDYKKAIYYFNIAIIFYPDSKETDQYLRILAQPVVTKVPPVIELSPIIVQPPVVVPSTTAVESQEAPSVLPVSSAQPQTEAAVTTLKTVSVPAQKPKQPPVVLSLSQITNNNQIKPKLQIELNSSVIIEGKNIQRFLVVQEGVIGVKIIDPDHLEIDALTIGTTFLHIWDDYGRHTLFVEVIFPKYLNFTGTAENNGVHHSRPFFFTYSNDFSTYYQGKNIHDLKRQNYDFNQTLGLNGETPYGFLDSSGSYTDFNSISQVDTYTVGLSQIPLEGTSDFNLRGFDAVRYLSPLTMPGTTLRGAFADVDLFDSNLGLSLDHGQVQVPTGFINLGQNQYNNSYVDAVKMTLFPKSKTDQYSFNFATAYGADRQQYLSKHDYSVEGLHKFNDYLTLSAEEGSDSSHDASLASLKWQEGNFKTGLHFRNIDKNYATVTSLPAYQGETGIVWTTDADLKDITESTFVEAYRDRLDANPDHPSAYNYDANGQLRAHITSNLWSDTDFNFVDTPGELSPTESLGVDERLSRSFGIWNSLNGTVFGGAGFQNSSSRDSDITNYDREDVIAGIQLPLTDHLSSYANYEYYWSDQPHSGGRSNPSEINAGFEYQRQVSQKFSYSSQVDYHDELGVKPDSNSFLSGEQSVIFTSGFNYAFERDMNVFADASASQVLSHIGNQPYDDFEVHLGVRITFGGVTYWDPLGTVSGIVFKDRNKDGKFGPGDEGIAGVKLKVGDKEAITDKNGRYHIKVRAKEVDVIPVLDTIPGGLLFSTPESLTVKIIQNHKTEVDFGLISQTGIYGLVFVDKIGSGVPNETDTFIGKVKVVLDGKASQISDTHGAFYFRQISPGEHVISIDLNSLALNMVPLVKLKNKINVAEGTNYMFNIPVQLKEAVEEQN